MKINKQKIVSLIALVFLIAGIVSLACTAYAIIVIESEEGVVEVTEPQIEYLLTVVPPSDGTLGDSFRFEGVLTADGVSLEGQTVQLWVKPEGGSYVATGLMDITDAMGGYSIEWTPEEAGVYYYKTVTNLET